MILQDNIYIKAQNNSDLNKRFTEVPIKEAFIKSNELLEDNGSVIIRDGLLSSKEDRNNKRIITFTNPNESIWLYKFQNDFRGFDKLDIDTKILEIEDNKYLVSEGFLKEFLCTYTWGEESYPREINERFGILTKEEWLNLLKETGFKIETIIESKEEYEKYLASKINIINEDGSLYEYPNMSIIVKAQKQKTK